MDDDKMVLSTSDEAAKFLTGLSGWVSRHGIFWGKDEHMARYDGCTHRPCNNCGKPVEKVTGWMLCDECRKKSDDERFAALERREWDGETPLTLFDGDEYFFERKSLDDFCEEHGTTIGKLQLIICEPNYAHEINSDFYCDELPEDQSLDDVAPGLAAKIDEVNAYIRETRPILSWGPSKFAAIIKEAIHA